MNRDFEYGVVKAGNEHYIMAVELVENVMKTANIEDYEIVCRLKGDELEGIICKHPFIDRDSVIILGDHVTLEAGTGCVHTAPGHGAEDFQVCRKYNIPVIVPVDDKGYLTSESNKTPFWFEVFINGGREPTSIDAITWAEKAAELGAGELLVTSMDKDGTTEGFDIELTLTISERTQIPIIASGGAGKLDHFYEVFTKGKADAALAASIFHYNKFPVNIVKKYLLENGVIIRP